jgi:hypothetical protein
MMNSVASSNYFSETNQHIVSLPFLRSQEGRPSHSITQSVAQASFPSPTSRVEGQANHIEREFSQIEGQTRYDEEQPGLYPNLERRVSSPNEEYFEAQSLFPVNSPRPQVIVRAQPQAPAQVDLINVLPRAAANPKRLSIAKICKVGIKTLFYGLARSIATSTMWGIMGSGSR